LKGRINRPFFLDFLVVFGDDFAAFDLQGLMWLFAQSPDAPEKNPIYPVNILIKIKPEFRVYSQFLICPQGYYLLVFMPEAIINLRPF
jgi:hypothetical protein